MKQFQVATDKDKTQVLATLRAVSLSGNSQSETSQARPPPPGHFHLRDLHAIGVNRGTPGSREMI